MAEFQSGETVPVANGGTGLGAIGSAGQIIKVNAAGNALEFGAEGDISITNLVAPTNSDLTLTTSGTGNIVLDAITFRGTTISSADSSIININEGVVVGGTLNTSGQATLSGLAYPTSDGTVGQFLKTDGSGTLAFADLSLGDLTIIGSTISAPSNADLSLQPGGTGDVLLSALRINGTTLDSSDSTKITIAEAVDVTGALVVGTSINIAGDGATVTGIKDEDDMSSNSATKLATQQSIKAYVDSSILTKDNTDEIAEGSTNLYFTNARADARITAALIDEDNMASNSDTRLPSQQSVKAYVDAQITAEDLDFQADSGGALSIDLDSETMTFTGGTGIDTSGSGNAVTFAIDSTVATLTGSQTLTNKTLTNPTINAATMTGAVVIDGVTIDDNTISTNESNSPLELKANGTGAVKVVSGGVTFTLPTTDGSDGDVLKTNGSGTLSFASSTTASDDTRAVVKNNKSVGTSARTIDYFQATSADMAWYFVALNDLTNDHSSASCFTVAHNDSDAFVSGARGGASGTANTLPTTSADVSSNQVRVKITAPSADSKISYYKIPISRANTADATAGVTVTTSNTDVDSASESIDSFAHASFRAAKYLIIIDDNAKTETGVTEALVVHNGTNAFVAQYGTINTGNNDMITLSAAIDGSNLVLSAAGLTPNLSLKIHKTLLADSMSAVSNTNQKIIGATTVSSSATAFDDFDLDDATAAMYYVVGKNATEGAFSVQEVYCSGAPGEASVSQGPFVSTKGTTQLEFTAAFKSDADNSVELSVASTSGGSTVVNAYRINCLAE
jgi:hypothetical protein